ncbi:MAG: TldD/PmbA family protein, partial [Verrucomicrobiota bacterium]|nr:TldD/PmbA family protein [Verrucomicrobiota bacterium]
MLISEEEAKSLTSKILALSKADSATVTLSGNERANVRFANNTATTNGFLEELSVSIESNFGKRSGTARTSQLDAASLEAAVRKSEEIAHLAPENSEFMPPLGRQEYLKSSAYSESTAATGPGKLASFFAPVIAEAVEKKVTAAGFLDSGATVAAIATSNGLFVYEKSTAL